MDFLLTVLHPKADQKLLKRHRALMVDYRCRVYRAASNWYRGSLKIQSQESLSSMSIPLSSTSIANTSYVIFQKWKHHGHSAVFLVHARSVKEAITRFLMAEGGGHLKLLDDGQLLEEYPGGKPLYYRHSLEYIEANCKTRGEWNIRKIDPSVWHREVSELLIGDHPDDIQSHIELCRPHFLQDHPPGRASAFVWYLESGTLVTFYRLRTQYRYKVLGRYLSQNLSGRMVVTEWFGDYEDIMNQLFLGRQ